MSRALRNIRGLGWPVLLLIWSAQVSAHDGLHAPDMLARVVAAVQQGNRVAVTLELTGLGGPLVLVALSAPGARAAPIAPIYVNFAEDARITTHLTFAAPPPAAFTLSLDFGPVGAAEIAVMPVPGQLAGTD